MRQSAFGPEVHATLCEKARALMPTFEKSHRALCKTEGIPVTRSHVVAALVGYHQLLHILARTTPHLRLHDSAVIYGISLEYLLEDIENRVAKLPPMEPSEATA